MNPIRGDLVEVAKEIQSLEDQRIAEWREKWRKHLDYELDLTDPQEWWSFQDEDFNSVDNPYGGNHASTNSR